MYEVSLKSDLPQPSHMAVMVLGAFARSLQPVDRGRSAAISKDLLSRLNETKDASDQKRLLAALGNVGSEDTMHACMTFLNSADPTIRSEAASSLRLVNLSVVDDLLIHLLETDPDANTRAEAIYSLSIRPPSKALIEALESSLDDTARGVRASAVDLLWKVHKKFPRVIDAIRKVAKSDADKDLREHAAKLLAK